MKSFENIRKILKESLDESPDDDGLFELTEDLDAEVEEVRSVLRATLAYVKATEPPGGPEWYRWRDLHNRLEDVTW